MGREEEEGVHWDDSSGSCLPGDLGGARNYAKERRAAGFSREKGAFTLGPSVLEVPLNF